MKKKRGKTMTKQEPSAWKKTIIAAMTSYIDAGSIVAGAAGLSLWQAYLGMDGIQLGLLGACLDITNVRKGRIMRRKFRERARLLPNGMNI